MNGFVLGEKDADYSDLNKPGRIVIEQDASGAVVCTVTGFEFRHSATCRLTATKAMAWGRDALAQAVQANILVPGGHIASRAD